MTEIVTLTRAEWKEKQIRKNSERWIGRTVTVFLLMVTSLMVYGLSDARGIQEQQSMEMRSPFFEVVVIENNAKN